MTNLDPLERVNVAKRDSVQTAERATPGPWQADDEACVYDSDNNLIAYTSVQHGWDTKFANAHILAAGQDMLAALRLALTVMDTSDPDTMDVANIVGAAIAKATGQRR